MRIGSLTRIGAVAAILAGITGTGTLAPASACGCGGVFSGPGERATVEREVALVGWDGRRETIVMQLALKSVTDRAALIVPTPTPATVTAGSANTFRELESLTRPEVSTEYRWFGSRDAGDGVAPRAATPGGSPTVLDRVRLGPVEATTLSGGELDGIRKWLTDNGYEVRPEAVATMAPYLREGWSFVAMRLSGDRPLRGELDPVRLSFDTDRMIYPMRMSGAATAPQSVLLYLLAEHRVLRTDAATTKHSDTAEFAGRITDTTDPELRQLSAGGRDYLTALRTTITEPAALTADFTYATAADDTPYRQRAHRTEYLEVFGFPAGLVLIAGFAGVGVIGLATLLLPRRER